MVLRMVQRLDGLAFGFLQIPLTQLTECQHKDPVDLNKQVAVGSLVAGNVLLHLQRSLRVGKGEMSITEDVADQPIHPDIPAGHLIQQRFNQRQTAGNIIGEGLTNGAHHALLYPR